MICQRINGGCPDQIKCNREGHCEHVKAIKAPIKMAETVPLKGDAEFAARLREIADLVEQGKVLDIVVAFDNLGDRCLERSGRWEDRWRMLAVLEYLKGGLICD